MSNQLTKVTERAAASKKPFSIVPQTLEEAERFAAKIADSALCPNTYKGKPGDVLIAMQMGAEVGLSPMQALQNIAVINGRPSVWGDAAIGIVRAHPKCEYIKEWMEGSVAKGDAVAYCEVKRKGEDAQVKDFDIAKAKQAKLWEKGGTWTNYPERMLQMRARGFALRDVFPDALRGLNLAEEVLDLPPDQYDVIEPEKPEAAPSRTDQLKKMIAAKPQVDEETGEVLEGEVEVSNETDSNAPTVDEIKSMIESAASINDLVMVADLARSFPEKDKKEIRTLYRKREKEIGEAE